jgi:hypothetical protein
VSRGCTLVSHQTAVLFSHNKPATNISQQYFSLRTTFLSEQTSTSHPPPAKRACIHSIGCFLETPQEIWLGFFFSEREKNLAQQNGGTAAVWTEFFRVMLIVARRSRDDEYSC